MSETVLTKATFDSKLRLYLFLSSVGILMLTVVGIVILPVWLFAGWWWAGRYFDSMKCELTQRRLRISRGVIFRKDKTIMLDKIQDMSLHHGPLQRWLGITSLQIETAGSSGPQGQADAKLVGIRDVHAFQEAVIAQRDRLTGDVTDGQARAVAPAPSPSLPSDPSVIALLSDIRDTLQRVEHLVKQ
jgi:putative membrane protein